MRTQIDNTQFKDNDLLPKDLASTNSEVDTYVPSYDLATGKFTWIAVAAGHDRQHSIVSELDHSDKAEYVDAPQSPMIITGGVLSAGTNAGTFKVSALTALIRTDTTDIANIKKITLAEQDNQAITLADTAYFVVLEYNSDSPRIQIATARPNGQTNISIGQILKDDSDNIHYLNSGNRLTSGVHKLHVRAADLRGQEIAPGDLTIADGGSKKISIAAGIVYRGINSFSFSEFDTSVSDTFTYVYYNGSNWVYVVDQTDINVDQYNNIASGLATCNKYKCDWIFLHPEDGHVYVVYGQDNLNLANIRDSAVPTLPDLIDVFGILVGRIIVDGGVTTFESIEMIENVTFKS